MVYTGVVPHIRCNTLLLFVTAVSLWGVGALLEEMWHPSTRFFIEGDPALSFPMYTQTVPTWALVVAVLVFPLIWTGLQILYARSFYYHLHKVLMAGGGLLPSALWYVLTLGVNEVVTQTLKSAVARPRPNFFAMCDYHGYRDAVSSGNLTAYWDVVHFGHEGDLSYCQGTTRDIADSQSSFPSGHSSTAFCAFGFLALVAWRSSVNVHVPWTSKRRPSLPDGRSADDAERGATSGAGVTPVARIVAEEKGSATPNSPKVLPNEPLLLRTPAPHPLDPEASRTAMMAVVLETIFIVVPLFFAGLIAISRLWDHWHDYSDVLVRGGGERRMRARAAKCRTHRLMHRRDLSLAPSFP